MAVRAIVVPLPCKLLCSNVFVISRGKNRLFDLIGPVWTHISNFILNLIGNKQIGFQLGS